VALHQQLAHISPLVPCSAHLQADLDDQKSFDDRVLVRGWVHRCRICNASLGSLTQKEAQGEGSAPHQCPRSCVDDNIDRQRLQHLPATEKPILVVTADVVLMLTGTQRLQRATMVGLCRWQPCSKLLSWCVHVRIHLHMGDCFIKCWRWPSHWRTCGRYVALVFEHPANPCCHPFVTCLCHSNSSQACSYYPPALVKTSEHPSQPIKGS
jgi:hypothetical protein